MNVALTGAAGFVGSHILTDLQRSGHEVTAFVRDDAQAAQAAAAGATPAVIDLYDTPTVASEFGRTDGAIHTASPGDATSANLDSAVVDAAMAAFAGTGKPVIVSSVVYGDGGGAVPGLLLGSPRDDDGNLIMLGSGRQHWSTVHAADLAGFFRRALENESVSGRYIVGDGLSPTVGDLTNAAAVAPGAVPGSDDEAKSRIGDYFAEVLLLDQGTDAAKARHDLGWRPSHPGLVDDFRSGSYRN